MSEIERLRDSNAAMLAALHKIASYDGHSWMYQRLAKEAIAKAELQTPSDHTFTPVDGERE